MPGLLHPAAAAAVQAGLEGLGARFHLGPVLASLNHQGDALQAHLSDGTLIECDLVLSAVGLRPRIDLAAAAGAAGRPGGGGVQGEGSVEGSGADIKALCHDSSGALLGYALTGTAVQEKLALNKLLPALLA